MGDKKIRVFDIETNGFTPTKIHCIAFQTSSGLSDIVDYSSMRTFFKETDVLVGHNIVRFDIPAVERLLGIKVKAQLVDTLALSWYLFPNMKIHKLEVWGVELGVAKPEVTDWDNLSEEEYIHRCREDVKINTLLWHKCWDYLHKLYSGDETRIWNLIKYLSFKLDCIREQEELGWDADEPLISSTLEEYLEEYEGKMELLADAMPPKTLYQTKTIPAKPLKKDGSLSAAGASWLKMLETEGLPISTKGPVQIIKGFERANPSSHKQLKAWFSTMGWVPETFKYVKEKDFKERAVPQVSLPNGKGLCGSIKKLYPKAPALELLDGIFILQHRLGMLKGFQRDMKEGKLVATVNGLTNTLRFKHMGLVNLPKSHLQYSKNIRGSLVAPEGYELCGSDMSSLEDRTKQHYIYPYDPDYVNSMLAEDFDPHLDIAELAGMLTTSQVSAHKSKLADYSKERSWAKTTNYCATYGGSGKAVHRQTSLTVKEGNSLIKIYWERNWAIKKVAEDAIVKTVNEQTWVWNPVSKFWYSLRFEKDIFSTLNQSTGAYCFDVFVGNLRRNGIKMIGQFHDEVIFLSKTGQQTESTRVLRGAIDKANDILKLNRELDIGIEFGENYAEVH